MLTEFRDSATSAVVAILDGRLAPINPGDPKDMHIFVFNNIFISYGVDMKESFKVCLYVSYCGMKMTCGLYLFLLLHCSCATATTPAGKCTVRICAISDMWRRPTSPT